MPFFPSNLHAHSNYSDGEHSCEDMVKVAIEQGMASVGISDHSPAAYDECAVPFEQEPLRIQELGRLKQQYAGIIEVYTGIELDYYSPVPLAPYDYAIGSVHYLLTPDGSYATIDYRHEDMEAAIQAFGSARALVERYYEVVADLALRIKPQVMGHLDLIEKKNADSRYFDTSAPWYQGLTAALCGHIAKSGCIVELNTSGWNVQGRGSPYPSPALLSTLYRHGVPMTISSDAHHSDNICQSFQPAVDMLRETGYRSVKILHRQRFRNYCLASGKITG